MSTWMMQSMLNYTSVKMQQEDTDEVLKQQSLKICEENACMELIIVATKVKRASSPPVDKVLVVLPSTADISATEMNSGVMQQ